MLKKFNEMLDLFEVIPGAPAWAQVCLLIRTRSRMKRAKKEKPCALGEGASKDRDLKTKDDKVS